MEEKKTHSFHEQLFAEQLSWRSKTFIERGPQARKQGQRKDGSKGGGDQKAILAPETLCSRRLVVHAVSQGKKIRGERSGREGIE